MFNLADVKDYLGITGTTDDARVTAAMNMSLSLAEKYCNRKFAKQAETEEIMPVHGRTVQLHRIPVDTITSVNKTHGGGALTDYVVAKEAGVVYLNGAAYDRKVTVSYTGGLDPIDDDILMALMEIVGAVWPKFKAGAGSGGSSAMAGQIKSVASDGARIEYFGDTGSTGSSSGFAGGMVSPFAQSILDLYRIEEC